MPWWVLVLLAWVVAIPVVTFVCVGVLRGGRLDDEAREASFAAEQLGRAPGERELSANGQLRRSA
jgi:hypothetical protein